MILIFYCDKIRTKFAILTIVGVSDIYYIHGAVQPSPLAIPRTFSSPQTNSVHVKHSLPVMPPPAPDFAGFIMEPTPSGGQTECISI